MKKVLLVLVSVGIVVMMFLLINNRFTPESAALNSSALTDDFKFVDQHGKGTATVLLFKSDEKEEYRTVFVEKSGLLYRSNGSTYTPYTSDPVQLVGGMSITTEKNALTYLSVISNDKNVSYIEAGVEPHVEGKGVSKGERVSFLFPFSEQIEKLNAVAFDKNGKKLYYFGYPKGTNVFRQEDFKWHKFE